MVDLVSSEVSEGNVTPLSPGLSGVAQKEMEWANAGEKLAVLNFSEKVSALHIS